MVTAMNVSWQYQWDICLVKYLSGNVRICCRPVWDWLVCGRQCLVRCRRQLSDAAQIACDIQSVKTTRIRAQQCIKNAACSFYACIFKLSSSTPRHTCLKWTCCIFIHCWARTGIIWVDLIAHVICVVFDCCLRQKNKTSGHAPVIPSQSGNNSSYSTAEHQPTVSPFSLSWRSSTNFELSCSLLKCSRPRP